MRTNYISIEVFLAFTMVCSFVSCSDTKTDNKEEPVAQTSDFNGFESQAKWGEHLVIIGACHDCHSPKIMTPTGFTLDSAHLLAGHLPNAPEVDVNRQELEKKGIIATQDLTSWVGPWGVSYAANLTSDATGVGNWSEDQFLYAIRNGKLKGLANSRPILPPMPWDMYRHMTDGELKAIFAYLKTTKPVENVVPAPKPPVVARSN